MKIEKNRLETLRKQIPELLNSGQITIENNFINAIGHKYKYTTNNDTIDIECITDPFTVIIKDCNTYIDVIQGIYNNRKSQADKALKKFERIVSILFVVMETEKALNRQ